MEQGIAERDRADVDALGLGLARRRAVEEPFGPGRRQGSGTRRPGNERPVVRQVVDAVCALPRVDRVDVVETEIATHTWKVVH
jgi:hypothetical protein